MSAGLSILSQRKKDPLDNIYIQVTALQSSHNLNSTTRIVSNYQVVNDIQQKKPHIFFSKNKHKNYSSFYA